MLRLLLLVALVAHTTSQIANEGANCWSQCNGGGACPGFCGSGLCCRAGWATADPCENFHCNFGAYGYKKVIGMNESWSYSFDGFSTYMPDGYTYDANDVYMASEFSVNGEKVWDAGL